MGPKISVIVPAFNASATLSLCLHSIFESEYRDFEVIVVDDHSTDNTRTIAQSMPCKLIERPVNCGAAAARNAGAAAASGSILFFVDADIALQPDSLQRIVTVFAERPVLAAIFGSYQADTPVANFFSQYKNLLHHYTHQTSSMEAKTFASGFGAVQAVVFNSLGGFDPRQRFLEDIEFGYRMHRAGYRVLLDRELQVTHYKRYTLASLVRSDFCGRAVPWTRLMLDNHIFQNDLNTRVSNIVSIPISILILAILLSGLSVWFAVLGATSIVAFVALNRQFLTFLLHERGSRFASAGALMTWFAYLYSGLGVLVGILSYARSQRSHPNKAERPENAAVPDCGNDSLT